MTYCERAHAQSHSPTDTHPGLQRRVSSSGDTRDMWGETELCGAGRTGGAAALLLGWPPPGCLQTDANLPVSSPSPTWPILKPHWPMRQACSTPSLPGTSAHPTRKLLVSNSLPSDQLHLVLSSWGSFDSNQQSTAWAAHASPEKHLVAGNQPQPGLQYCLNKSWRFAGLTQAVAGLGVT